MSGRVRGALAAAFVAASVFAGSPGALAQEVYGAYCGQVAWQGRAPVDTWVIFLTGDRYSSPVSAGAFTDAYLGVTVQHGESLILRSDDAPHYVMETTARDGRIFGTVSNDREETGAISLAQMRGTGAGLRSSPLPPDFSISAARRALDGDIDGLNGAVTWAWTPQGSDYWRAIHRDGRLTESAAAALRDWIRRAESGEEPACDAD